MHSPFGLADPGILLAVLLLRFLVRESKPLGVVIHERGLDWQEEEKECRESGAHLRNRIALAAGKQILPSGRVAAHAVVVLRNNQSTSTCNSGSSTAQISALDHNLRALSRYFFYKKLKPLFHSCRRHATTRRLVPATTIAAATVRCNRSIA